MSRVHLAAGTVTATAKLGKRTSGTPRDQLCSADEALRAIVLLVAFGPKHMLARGCAAAVNSSHHNYCRDYRA